MLPAGSGKTVASQIVGDDGYWDSDLGHCWLNCIAASSKTLTDQSHQFGLKNSSGNPKFIRVGFANLWYESNLIDTSAALELNISEAVDYLSGEVPFISYLTDLDLDYDTLDKINALDDSGISADQTKGTIPKICCMNVVETDAHSLALGVPSLMDVYVVFDLEVPMIWLGQSANCNSDFQAVNTTARPMGIGSLISNCVPKGDLGLSRKTLIIVCGFFFGVFCGVVTDVIQFNY